MVAWLTTGSIPVGFKQTRWQEMKLKEDEEAESLILTIGKDGKASIYKPEDYVEMRKEDADLCKDFIDANKELFNDFVKNRKK